MHDTPAGIIIVKLNRLATMSNAKSLYGVFIEKPWTVDRGPATVNGYISGET